MEGTGVCITISLVLGVIAVLIGTMLGTSLKRLESDQVGLQYDKLAMTLADKPKHEGLHIGPVGYEFVIFSSTFSNMAFTVDCMNADGVDIEITVAYQYRVNDSELRDVVLEFKNEENYATILRAIGEATVYEVCSIFNTTQFQISRSNITATVKRILTENYENVHAEISDLQISNYNRPGSLEAAVRNKETARADINVAKSEKEKKLVQAETSKETAVANADIRLAKAWADYNITIQEAESAAEGILHAYTKEAETYAAIVHPATGLNLNTEGFLSYLGVRVISSAVNPVYLGMDPPARSGIVP